ncbi:MAG: aldo/keto reductase [Synergistaceae bacterium]|nr:aldo/keto reductase [Synergistaceae bacterium]
MRLPTLENGAIDTFEADKMLAYAYENGVNYFDTAYGYHGGESERFIGRSLARFPRETWCLADKFPGYEARTEWNPADVFEEQLHKCGVEYFDFYLLHNVNENTIKTYLNSKWGIIDYLLEQKNAGRIRFFGFSCHAGMETFLKFMELHGDKKEFCQLEINALDWFLQDARKKYEFLMGRNIPVWIMEPVRGGKLASFSAENEKKLKAERPDESMAAWAFRWIQSLPRISVTLSGMTTMEQVWDNINTFREEKPLNAGEKKLYEEIIAGLADMLPCTACRYCCPDCPKELNIPNLLALYNDCRYEPSVIVRMIVDGLKPSKRPSACINCGKCKKICPQNIDVPETLKYFQSILDTLPHIGTVNDNEES